MLSMLTPSGKIGNLFFCGLKDGTVNAVHYNPAVPASVLREIVQWMRDGACRAEGYEPHPWSPGM